MERKFKNNQNILKKNIERNLKTKVERNFNRGQKGVG